jgi:hypothetical protein
LWYGLIDEAVVYLEEIDKDSIKAMETLDKLIEYLRRNKPYIPCYSVRKELGLCNSILGGEKMNDLIVSTRQKKVLYAWQQSLP